MTCTSKKAVQNRTPKELRILYQIALASQKGTPLSYADTLKHDPAALKKLFLDELLLTRTDKFNRTFVYPAECAPGLNQIVPPDSPSPVWNTWSVEMIDKANAAHRDGADVVTIAILIQRPVNEVRARMNAWFTVPSAPHQSKQSGE